MTLPEDAAGLPGPGEVEFPTTPPLAPDDIVESEMAPFDRGSNTSASTAGTQPGPPAFLPSDSVPVPAIGVPPPPSASARWDGSPPARQHEAIDVGGDHGNRAGFGKRRSWWGMGDIALGAVFIIVIATIGGLVATLTGFTGTGLLVVATLPQQAAMFAWPILVTRWKGVSVRQDWGLSFKWIDVIIGFGVGIVGLIAAGLVSLVVTQLFGITDLEGATNTGMLDDASNSPWLIGLVFILVIGAPLSEELFFRGLCLRSIERRFGPVVGAIGSTAMFTIIHLPDGFGDNWATNIAVLWVSIATLGAVFATAALLFRRLGPSIFAHMTVNLVSVIATLNAPV